MFLWLLEKSFLERIESLYESGASVTSEQQEKFLASVGDPSFAVASVGNRGNGVAHISIEGLLTGKPSFWAWLLGDGNTTYRSIVDSIAAAESDTNVKEIVLDIDSPGGEASAEWVEAMDAIANATKPITARVGNMAASAAYGLASQADTIVAKNSMTIVGSVGVVTSRYIDKNKVTITSTNAPNKRPDPTTDEGIAAIRKMIDDMEAIFIEKLASGRNTTAEKVKSDFGRGDTVLASEGLKVGMLDSISESNNKPAAVVLGGIKKRESKAMDKTELKSQHPELYLAMIDMGVAQERDRVKAHIVLGKGSGDMETAIEAIENGDGMTATIQAKHMAAAMNKNDKGKRADDDKQAADALDGADTKNDDDDATAMEIAKGVAAQLGVTDNE